MITPVFVIETGGKKGFFFLQVDYIRNLEEIKRIRKANKVFQNSRKTLKKRLD